MGRSIFGKGNSLQSKYYCFGHKENATQNESVAEHSTSVILCGIVNAAVFISAPDITLHSLTNFSTGLTALDGSLECGRNKTKLRIHDLLEVNCVYSDSGLVMKQI